MPIITARSFQYQIRLARFPVDAQMALEPVANGANVPALLSPFFVLDDFRVAASHLTSTDRANQIMATITGRLNIEPGAGLLEPYNVLSEALAASYKRLIKANCA